MINSVGPVFVGAFLACSVKCALILAFGAAGLLIWSAVGGDLRTWMLVVAALGLLLVGFVSYAAGACVTVRLTGEADLRRARLLGISSWAVLVGASMAFFGWAAVRTTDKATGVLAGAGITSAGAMAAGDFIEELLKGNVRLVSDVKLTEGKVTTSVWTPDRIQKELPQGAIREAKKEAKEAKESVEKALNDKDVERALKTARRGLGWAMLFSFVYLVVSALGAQWGSGYGLATGGRRRS